MKNLGGCDRPGVIRNFRQGGADRAGSVARDRACVAFEARCCKKENPAGLVMALAGFASEEVLRLSGSYPASNRSRM
jgi:hypothetical protein